MVPWPPTTPLAVCTSGGRADAGVGVLLVGAVVTAFVARDAFVAAHRTIGWVVACAIVALLIDPAVDLVDRLMPRWPP